MSNEDLSRTLGRLEGKLDALLSQYAAVHADHEKRLRVIEKSTIRHAMIVGAAVFLLSTATPIFMNKAVAYISVAAPAVPANVR